MDMDTAEFVIVLTTLPSGADAEDLATALVTERVAACVNILGDMRSTYRMGDEIEHDHERQIVIKTTASRLPDLWDHVREAHPYEIPEFVVVPVIDGSGAYLSWLRESTQAAS